MNFFFASFAEMLPLIIPAVLILCYGVELVTRRNPQFAILLPLLLVVGGTIVDSEFPSRSQSMREVLKIEFECLLILSAILALIHFIIFPAWQKMKDRWASKKLASSAGLSPDHRGTSNCCRHR